MMYITTWSAAAFWIAIVIIMIDWTGVQSCMTPVQVMRKNFMIDPSGDEKECPTWVGGEGGSPEGGEKYGHQVFEKYFFFQHLFWNILVKKYCCSQIASYLKLYLFGLS